MSIRVSISQARARLPELALRAMEAPHDYVIIEHRDHEERLALTTERYIRMLEARNEALMKQLTRNAEPFKLEGSMSTDLTPEELEAWLLKYRAEQAEADEQRLRRIFEED